MRETRERYNGTDDHRQSMWLERKGYWGGREGAGYLIMEMREWEWSEVSFDSEFLVAVLNSKCVETDLKGTEMSCRKSYSTGVKF